MRPSAAATAGQQVRLGAYDLIGLLGEGGMGSVFAARHRITGEARALKIIKPELSADTEFINRFLREVRVAATVHHENLVKVMEPGMDGNAVFLPMELLHGETLASLLHRVGRLSPADAASILLCVGRGISAIHAKGVLHRDIKPMNIFLAIGEGAHITPKLLDFGMARELSDTEHTRTGIIGGSPHYMAPEQAAGSKNLTEKVDQYSLAVIAYQMMTGQRPYEDDDNHSALSKLLRGAPFPHVNEVDRTVPIPVAKAIHRAMSVDPDARFPAVGAFITALAAPVAAHLGSVSAIAALRGKALEMAETAPDERIDFDNTMIAAFGDAGELLEGLEASCVISTPTASTPTEPIAGQHGTMILNSLDSCVIEVVPGDAPAPSATADPVPPLQRKDVLPIGTRTSDESSTSIVIPKARLPLIVAGSAVGCLAVGGAIAAAVLVLGSATDRADDALRERPPVVVAPPSAPTPTPTPAPTPPVESSVPMAEAAANAPATEPAAPTMDESEAQRARDERRRRRAEERERRARDAREREAAAAAVAAAMMSVAPPPPTMTQSSMSNEPCVPMNGIPCID